MIRVGISGAAGRMGGLVAEALAESGEFVIGGLYAPGHEGFSTGGVAAGGHPDALADCDVILEVTRPDVVMANLWRWKDMGAHVVVGTSGFDSARMAELTAGWGGGPPNCLVVPNFSVGAVLMMRFAEAAAPYFLAAEVIELHHDRKADAPSGTALDTARRIGEARPDQLRHVESKEMRPGARGATESGVNVHSVRLPGLLAHQEVVLGAEGEVLTIRHDATDRKAYLPGIFMALRAVGGIHGVSLGLEQLF